MFLPLRQNLSVDKLTGIVILLDYNDNRIAYVKIAVVVPNRIKAQACCVVVKRTKNAASIFATDDRLPSATDGMAFVRIFEGIGSGFPY